MMKIGVAALAALAFAGSVHAQATCNSFGNVRTCTDRESGNRYTTQEWGDYSTTRGTNSRTGSSWSQSTQNFGDTSTTRGRDADGNSWTMRTQTFGDTTTYSGTDSDGNYYRKSCTTVLGRTTCR